MTGVVEASEGYDVYNTDGTFLGSIKNEGWNLVNGSYYYMKDGDILKIVNTRQKMEHCIHLIVMER